MRCTTQLVGESPDRSKSWGVSGTVTRSDLDVSQSEESARKLGKSHGDGRQEVREQSH